MATSVWALGRMGNGDKVLKCLFVPASVLLIINVLLCITIISPGNVGVVVNLFGDKKGVEANELSVGAHLIAPWKQIYTFPTFEQNHEWSNEDAFIFQTSEGLSVKANIGIAYHLVAADIPVLFAKYRRGMAEITHLFIKNNLRNAINVFASKMQIEDLIGPKKEEFFINVLNFLQKELSSAGFIITHVYVIGEFDVPTNVKVALNDKIAATQRAQQRENELREAEAQAKKSIAEAEGLSKSKIIRANAEAQSNKVIAESITKDLLAWNSINKWDGKVPQVSVGKETPFIYNLPSSS